MIAGMQSGTMIRINSTAPLRRPSVSAAPRPPSRLSTGVPRTRPATSDAIAAGDMSKSRPNTGAATTSGRPVRSQCETALATAIEMRAPGTSSICSSEPSAWSAA